MMFFVSLVVQPFPNPKRRILHELCKSKSEVFKPTNLARQAERYGKQWTDLGQTLKKVGGLDK